MKKFKLSSRNLEFSLLVFWVFSILVTLIGFSPVWLFIGTIGIIYCAFQTRYNKELAALFSLSSLLAVDTVFLRLEPFLPWDFELSNLLLLLGIGMFSFIFCYSNKHAKNSLSHLNDSRVISTSCIAVFGFVWVTIFSLTNGFHLAWAMKNDAVWTTVMARLALQDGGINPAVRALSSPLTSGLLAQSMSFGRGEVDPGFLLRHDLVRNGEVWIGLLFIASSLASWIAVKHLKNQPSIYVWASGLVAGAIPLSWYVAGFSFQLGFYNAALPLIGLLIMWLAWNNGASAPKESVALLSLSSLILLSSWVPLASLSFVLTIIVLIRKRTLFYSEILKFRSLAWILILIAPFIYLLVVSLPDYLREGKALSSDGGMISISPANLAAIATVAILVTALKYLTTKQQNPLIGVVSISVTSFVACAFLVYQRLGKEDLWGYYPAKLGWLISILFIIIIVTEIFSWPSLSVSGKLAKVMTLTLAVFVSTALMIQVPPSGLLNNFPNGLIRGFFPLTMTLLPFDKGVEDQAADKVLSLSNPTQKNVVFRSEQNESLELFINGWLLQLQTEKAENPIREFAYLLDGTTPSMLCGVEELWGPGVVVHTTNPELDTILESTCTGVKPRVTLE